ncbi:MAG: MotA/TolQ/ExbB proton channel family protein [Calditrichaeota bacterium]|nr:MAG: MotA/TolQ/ExbB proton channel family protein [Calditrichota bacterium]
MSEILAGFSTESSSFFYMWVLAVVAAVMVAIAIERSYYIIVRSNIDAPKFMAKIRSLVRKEQYAEALNLCETAPEKALVRVVASGLRPMARGGELDFRTIQNSVDEGTLEVIPKLQERTGFLAMIANVATLIGLMGTIWGLIIAFRSASIVGIDAAEKSRLLADGISTAMNTTLMGLAIAIPAILIYTYLHNKTIRIIDEIDEHTVKLINLITGNQ